MSETQRGFQTYILLTSKTDTTTMTLCLVTDKGSLKLWCCMVKSILVKFILTIVHLVPSVEYWTWYTLGPVGNNSTTKLHPKLISFSIGRELFQS